MFDLIFSGLQAYTQIGMFIGAIICLGVGGAMLANALYWRVAVEFRDGLGSNPPSYRQGDKITVLYLPSSPERNAIIDRGRFWNWLVPALLFAFAALMAWMAAAMLRSSMLRTQRAASLLVTERTFTRR